MRFNKYNTVTIESEDDYLMPAFENNNIPVCLFSSNEYAPFCGVLIHSLLCNSMPQNNYDIIVLEKNICNRHKRLIVELINAHKNISVRFINVNIVDEKIFDITIHSYFNIAGCLKLLLLSEIFKYYDKFIALDSDLVIENDIAKLFGINIDGYYLSAVDDIIMKRMVAIKQIYRGNKNAPMIPSGEYVSQYLEMGTDKNYYNTGVVLFNLNMCRNHNLFDQAIKLLQTRNYWFLEQDVLNQLCNKFIKELDLKWNVLSGNKLLDEIKEILDPQKYSEVLASYDNYHIMHFAGGSKPWYDPAQDYADRFYYYAKMTPWYEEIIFNMHRCYCDAKYAETKTIINSQKQWLNKQIQSKIKSHTQMSTVKHKQKSTVKHKLKRKIILPIIDKLLPKNTLRREAIRQMYWTLKGKEFSLNIKFYIRMYFLPKKITFFAIFPWREEYKQRKKIRTYKNKHRGERCFFIGNGPSLTHEDLALLEGETTFAVNNIFPMTDEYGWCPTYYFFQEFIAQGRESTVKTFYNKILQANFPTVFVPYCKTSKKLSDERENETVLFPISVDFCMFNNMPLKNFSTDVRKIVYAGYLSFYSLLQIIYYMGFTEIYLLGCDANYTLNQPHFYKKDDIDTEIHITDKHSKRQTEGINMGFKGVYDAITAIKGVDIYNSTRGGQLELFPRVNLENILN